MKYRLSKFNVKFTELDNLVTYLPLFQLLQCNLYSKQPMVILLYICMYIREFNLYI